MTDSSAPLTETIWNVLDAVRDFASPDDSLVFVLCVLLHRLRHPPRTDSDRSSIWQNINDQPLAKIDRLVDEVERELDIRIKPLPLDTSSALHVLYLVNEGVKAAGADGDSAQSMDRVIDRVSARTEEFHTPRSIVAAMVDLLNPQPNRSIFDPAAGTGGMLSASLEFLAKNGNREALEVYGTERDLRAIALARLTLALQGHSFEGLAAGDSFGAAAPGRPSKFDYVISNPPVYRESSRERLHRLSEQPTFVFGPPLIASDFNYIQLAVSSLKPGGRSALLVRLAPLFSGGKEQEIRKQLVMAGCVECVVSLAPRLLPTTSAPCAILLLRAPPREVGQPKVKLVAADSEFGVDDRGKRILTPANIDKIIAAVRSIEPIDGFSTIQTLDELTSKDFSLVPSSYLEAEREWINLGPNTVMQRLGDVAKIRRGPPLGGLPEGDTPILQGRDLPQRKIYKDELERKALLEGNGAQLTTEQGDILIQRIGGSPSPHYVDKSLVDVAVSDTAYVVRLHKPDEITARFLVQFLRSSEGRARLRAALPVGTVPTLSLKYLQQVRVPFADPDVMKLALDLEDLENVLHEHVELASELKSKLFGVRSPDQFAATIRDLKLRYQILKDSLQYSDNLSALNATIGVATLEEAISFWEQHKDSDDEAFWHRVLQERSFLFAQLFHYPIVIVGSNVYLGGKLLDNRHGKLGDFLAKNRNTGGALIIEIKTPRTRLLDREYRQDVFPWSAEVSGAISQVLHYQSSLTRNVVELRVDVDEHLEADAPRCLVIAGNAGEQLDNRAKRRSFERLRESLHGVSVIGFDELFGRAKEMLKIMTSPR